MFTTSINGKLFNSFWRGHNIVTNASLVSFSNGNIKCRTIHEGGFILFNGSLTAQFEGQEETIPLDTEKLESIGSEDVVLKYDGNIITARVGKSTFKIPKYANGVIKEPPQLKSNPQCIMEFDSGELVDAIDKIVKFKNTSIMFNGNGNIITIGDNHGEVITDLTVNNDVNFVNSVSIDYFYQVIKYLAKLDKIIIIRTDSNLPFFVTQNALEFILAPIVDRK